MPHKDKAARAAYHKAWREEHPEYRRYQRAWLAANPGYIEQWKKDNPDKVREYARKYYHKRKSKTGW